MEVQTKIRSVEKSVSGLAFEHPCKEAILKSFVAVYREMESDDRLDGACHLLAALSHVVLAEHGVTNDVCVGEVLYGARSFCGSHSWVQIGSLVFDVASARPLNPMPATAVLAGYQVPNGTSSANAYGVPVPLDAAAQYVARQTVGEFMAGFENASGIDFWEWAATTCGRLGLPTNPALLEKKYGETRWKYVKAVE